MAAAPNGYDDDEDDEDGDDADVEYLNDGEEGDGDGEFNDEFAAANQPSAASQLRSHQAQQGEDSQTEEDYGNDADGDNAEYFGRRRGRRV